MEGSINVHNTILSLDASGQVTKLANTLLFHVACAMFCCILLEALTWFKLSFVNDVLLLFYLKKEICNIFIVKNTGSTNFDEDSHICVTILYFQ